MTHLNIAIPEDVKAALEARAAESGHTSLESFVAELVCEEAKMIDYGGPANLEVRSREDLERMLQETSNGSSREMTTQDWDQMRKTLLERHRITSK